MCGGRAWRLERSEIHVRIGTVIVFGEREAQLLPSERALYPLCQEWLCALKFVGSIGQDRR